MSFDQKAGLVPVLGFWRSVSDHRLTHISAAFPEPAGFACDAWCYETADLSYAGGRPLEGGGIELRHAWRDHDQVLVTTALPQPGAVEITAHLEDPDGRPPHPEPATYPFMNICWQLLRAPGFASWPDPYPEFVKRCFIFTDDGLTTLDRTARFNIPVRGADDPYNNPPWVQMYLPVWQPLMQAGPDYWAAYSTDRYTYPVIGVISRDGRYLAAIATQGNYLLCQAWHDCVHNYADWLLAPNGTHKIWLMFIYVMENDPEALLQRIAVDLPGAITQQQTTQRLETAATVAKPAVAGY